MAKRALLIGSQTYGLSGANGDVALMAETLDGRGFETAVPDRRRRHQSRDHRRVRSSSSDTRAGPSDPVVIYYSGHGGRTALDGWEDLQRRGQRSHLRYLVPFDMAASSETDFRGLLSEELSSLQRRLTAKTENVTTILDCCHSGTMSRDADRDAQGRSPLLPVSRPRSRCWPRWIAGSRAGGALDDSNPLAVRLVACDPAAVGVRAAERAGWPARRAHRTARAVASRAR